MLSDITQGVRREKPIAETANILRNIQARVGQVINQDGPKQGAGMTAQLVDRLRGPQIKLK